LDKEICQIIKYNLTYHANNSPVITAGFCGKKKQTNTHHMMHT